MMSNLNLSNQLRALTRGFYFEKDQQGMSPARVFRLIGLKENLYLKVSDCRYGGTTYDVAREKDVLLWLQGKVQVPKVLHYEEYEGCNYLLMREVQGLPGNEDYRIHRDPQRLIRFYAQGLRQLQEIDIRGCPFDTSVESRLAELDHLLQNDLADIDPGNWQTDTPFTDPQALFAYLKTHQLPEDLVFSHGDFGDSNILIWNDQINGFIDFGRGGKADRWVDIAFCVRSIQNDLGNRQEDLDYFFTLLEIEPDWNKIRYQILMDELF